jgi:tRNA pseudouridine55 synthase
MINLHKPAGPSSRGCVDRIERLVRPFKVGHTGTLDPMASGVLLVAVGEAVRLIEYMHGQSKAYRAIFCLGQTSPSVDLETLVTRLDGPTPAAVELQSCLDRFRGPILQQPPAYSAVKIQGKRAYELARMGAGVEVPYRQCHIDQLELEMLTEGEFELTVRCSSGTYIRSLGRDIARACGSDAVMKSLVRTAIGPLELERALPWDGLETANLEEQLLDPLQCIPHPQRVELERWQLEELRHGRCIRLEQADPTRLTFATDSMGRLRSVLVHHQANIWAPRKNFFGLA